jgi:hypothetical protein
MGKLIERYVFGTKILLTDSFYPIVILLTDSILLIVVVLTDSYCPIVKIVLTIGP